MDDLIDHLLHILQSAPVADILNQLREEPEAIGCLLPPTFKLRFGEDAVERGVQLNAVELRSVVDQLVLRSLRIEVLEVGAVPFGAAYKRRIGPRGRTLPS
jgi:hypothetical protein